MSKLGIVDNTHKNEQVIIQGVQNMEVAMMM
jgi:hypothetical protein